MQEVTASLFGIPLRLTYSPALLVLVELQKLATAIEKWELEADLHNARMWTNLLQMWSTHFSFGCVSWIRASNHLRRDQTHAWASDECATVRSCTCVSGIHLFDRTHLFIPSTHVDWQCRVMHVPTSGTQGLLIDVLLKKQAETASEEVRG